jgi:uncharacterized protein with GYD domain
LQATYSDDALKGLRAEGGSARRAVTERLFESLGGRLEAAYWALEEDMFVGIVEVPDNVTMAAIRLAVGASAAGRIRVTVLLSPDEVDAAAKVEVPYRRPGG